MTDSALDIAYKALKDSIDKGHSPLCVIPELGKAARDFKAALWSIPGMEAEVRRRARFIAETTAPETPYYNAAQIGIREFLHNPVTPKFFADDRRKRTPFAYDALLPWLKEFENGWEAPKSIIGLNEEANRLAELLAEAFILAPTVNPLDLLATPLRVDTTPLIEALRTWLKENDTVRRESERLGTDAAIYLCNATFDVQISMLGTTTIFSAFGDGAKALYDAAMQMIVVDTAGGEPPATTPGAIIKPGKKGKKSTAKGDAKAKIIAALTLHHQYANGSALNQEPIQVNQFATKIGVAGSTVSKFFDDNFKGYDKYQASCRVAGTLIASLKMLNGEYTPSLLLKNVASIESKNDDE